jgi:hypothetical protein
MIMRRMRVSQRRVYQIKGFGSTPAMAQIGGVNPVRKPTLVEAHGFIFSYTRPTRG